MSITELARAIEPFTDNYNKIDEMRTRIEHILLILLVLGAIILIGLYLSSGMKTSALSKADWQRYISFAVLGMILVGGSFSGWFLLDHTFGQTNMYILYQIGLVFALLPFMIAQITGSNIVTTLGVMLTCSSIFWFVLTGMIYSSVKACKDFEVKEGEVDPWYIRWGMYLWYFIASSGLILGYKLIKTLHVSYRCGVFETIGKLFKNHYWIMSLFILLGIGGTLGQLGYISKRCASHNLQTEPQWVQFLNMINVIVTFALIITKQFMTGFYMNMWGTFMSGVCTADDSSNQTDGNSLMFMFLFLYASYSWIKKKFM